MAGRKGHVGFKAGGSDYAIRFGMNEMAAAEESFGLPFGEIIDKLSVAEGRSASFSDMRRLFAAGVGVDLKTAGEIMDATGIPRASELLGEAIRAAFPDEESEAGNGQGQNAT